MLERRYGMGYGAVMRAMQLFVILTLIALPGLLWAQAEEECAEHGLQLVDCKEQLRRWSGMRSFARWRLLNLKLDACAREGKVGAEMTLAPPAAWSRQNLPARVKLRLFLRVDSGAPVGPAPADDWRRYARGVKHALARVERNRVVRRFVARYRVLQADLEPENQRQMRLTLLADPGMGVSALRAPSLTWSEAAGGRVVAYRIGRMDGLPVRPELLRFVEVISTDHPHCTPTLIEASRHVAMDEQPDPKDEKNTKMVERVFWKLQAELHGAGCPVSMAAQIEPNGTVSNVSREAGLASSF